MASGLLREKKLFPGLFVSYTEIALARDYGVLGGCFQSNYLKNMVQGLTKTLAGEKDFIEETDILKKKQFYMLAGLITGICRSNENIYPMGAVERYAAPMSRKEFKDSLSISVSRALELGSIVFYERVVPGTWHQTFLECGFKEMEIDYSIIERSWLSYISGLKMYTLISHKR